MFFLVYVSSAVTPFTPSELVDLLAKSHENNGKLDISGMLLYKDGNFMQVLEGEETAVRRLYTKIGRDPRHKGIIDIIDGQQESRQFASWSMAFRDLSGPDPIIVPGYSDFLTTRLDDPELTSNPSICQQLLKTFKQSL